VLADATPWLHAIAAASPVQTTPARNQRPQFVVGKLVGLRCGLVCDAAYPARPTRRCDPCRATRLGSPRPVWSSDRRSGRSAHRARGGDEI